MHYVPLSLLTAIVGILLPMPYFIAYLIVPLLICFSHPQLRKILGESAGDKAQRIVEPRSLSNRLKAISAALWANQ